MKTRVLIIALALALTLAMTTTAFAGANATSTGSITFTPLGNNDDGVYDPQFPPGDIGTNHGLESMGLNFGTHQFSPFTRTYNSITGYGGTPGGGLNNGRAGMLVISSSNNWHVRVAVNPFTSAGNPVMSGFTLQLLPNGTTFTPTPGTTFTPATVTVHATSGSAVIASSTHAGMFGANYEGNLMVPGGTAPTNAQAQAVLDWTFFASAP